MNNFGSTRVPDTTYQVSKPSLNLFPRRRFLKVFTIYGHGDYSGHRLLSFVPSASRCSTWNLVTIGSVASQRGGG